MPTKTADKNVNYYSFLESNLSKSFKIIHTHTNSEIPLRIVSFRKISINTEGYLLHYAILLSDKKKNNKHKLEKRECPSTENGWHVAVHFFY